MDYFKHTKNLFSKIKDSKRKSKKRDVNFIQCKKCKKLVSEKELKSEYFICPHCSNYLKMPVRERFNLIFDKYEIIKCDFENKNLIDFPDYDEKREKCVEKTGFNEAVVVARGNIGLYRAYVFVLDSDFFMGSLSRNAGHIIAECFNRAKKEKLPVISFVSSGGARMQEGIFSLIQMANTVFALKSHGEKNLYISVMTNPTYGGVTASFASLGDINLAEPGAMIGFTGPRVIEQTINKKLPEGFQSAEFLLEHGFLDDIVKRENMKAYLEKILEYHQVII